MAGRIILLNCWSSPPNRGFITLAMEWVAWPVCSTPPMANVISKTISTNEETKWTIPPSNRRRVRNFRLGLKCDSGVIF